MVFTAGETFEENYEHDQVTKKNSLTMARELEKFRAEVANIEKGNGRLRSTSIPIPENYEHDQVTEKNSLTMARELEKFHAEAANAEKRERASPINTDSKFRSAAAQGNNRSDIQFFRVAAILFFRNSF
uniref:Uncharacterized protein n=1 Tax=Tanacetum cinerariifolium TaxID=118510 RepID=A0A6L2L3A7_TANCI|nr:hypothetical protein [Tanacetum cinerariifolium]